MKKNVMREDEREDKDEADSADHGFQLGEEIEEIFCFYFVFSSLICAFIHALFYSFRHPFIQSFIHSSIHSFVCQFIHSFIRSFNHLNIESQYFSLNNSHSDPFMYACIYLLQYEKPNFSLQDSYHLFHTVCLVTYIIQRFSGIWL